MVGFHRDLSSLSPSPPLSLLETPPEGGVGRTTSTHTKLLKPSTLSFLESHLLRLHPLVQGLWCLPTMPPCVGGRMGRVLNTIHPLMHDTHRGLLQPSGGQMRMGSIHISLIGGQLILRDVVFCSKNVYLMYVSRAGELPPPFLSPFLHGLLRATTPTFPHCLSLVLSYPIN